MAVHDIPKKIYNETIKDQIFFEQYTNGINKQVLQLLEDAQSEILAALVKNDPTAPTLTKWKKARLERLDEDISDILDIAYGDVENVTNSSLNHIGLLQAENTINKLNGAVGVNLFTVNLTKPHVESIINNSMIQGKVIGDWWKNAKEASKNKISASLAAGTQAIQVGMVQGESIGQLINRIKGTKTTPGVMNVSKREATALVRTSAAQVLGNTKAEVFKANEDVLGGVTFIATLDNRTTPICRAVDNLSYDMDLKPIGHTFPYPGNPPLHWQCRTTLAPKTLSFEELAGPGSKLNKKQLQELNDLPVGTRSSLGGQIPGDMNYNDWLLTQSESVQKSILGPGRFKLWKNNNLDMIDLVNNKGKQLTLVELKASLGDIQAKKLVLMEVELKKMAIVSKTIVDFVEKIETFSLSDSTKYVAFNKIIQQEGGTSKYYTNIQKTIEAQKALRAEQRLIKSIENPEVIVTFKPGQKLPLDLYKPIKGAKATLKKGDDYIYGDLELKTNPLLDKPFESTPGYKQSTGMILIDEDTGKIYLNSPANQFGGYNNSFPKGTIEHGLSPQEVAIKEVFEETGLQGELLFLLGDYKKTTSISRYYVGVKTGGTPAMMGWESEAVQLCPINKLDDLLNVGIDKKIAKDFIEKYNKAQNLGEGDIKKGFQLLAQDVVDEEAYSALVKKYGNVGNFMDEDVQIFTKNLPGITWAAKKDMLQDKVIDYTSTKIDDLKMSTNVIFAEAAGEYKYTGDFFKDYTGLKKSIAEKQIKYDTEFTDLFKEGTKLGNVGMNEQIVLGLSKEIGDWDVLDPKTKMSFFKTKLTEYENLVKWDDFTDSIKLETIEGDLLLKIEFPVGLNVDQKINYFKDELTKAEIQLKADWEELTKQLLGDGDKFDAYSDFTKTVENWKSLTDFEKLQIYNNNVDEVLKDVKEYNVLVAADKAKGTNILVSFNKNPYYFDLPIKEKLELFKVEVAKLEPVGKVNGKLLADLSTGDKTWLNMLDKSIFGEITVFENWELDIKDNIIGIWGSLDTSVKQIYLKKWNDGNFKIPNVFNTVEAKQLIKQGDDALETTATKEISNLSSKKIKELTDMWKSLEKGENIDDLNISTFQSLKPEIQEKSINNFNQFSKKTLTQFQINKLKGTKITAFTVDDEIKSLFEVEAFKNEIESDSIFFEILKKTPQEHKIKNITSFLEKSTDTEVKKLFKNYQIVNIDITQDVLKNKVVGPWEICLWEGADPTIKAVLVKKWIKQGVSVDEIKALGGIIQENKTIIKSPIEIFSDLSNGTIYSYSQLKKLGIDNIIDVLDEKPYLIFDKMSEELKDNIIEQSMKKGTTYNAYLKELAVGWKKELAGLRVGKVIDEIPYGSVDNLDELLVTVTKKSLLDDVINNDANGIIGALSDEGFSKIPDVSNIKRYLSEKIKKGPISKIDIESDTIVVVAEKSVGDFASMSVDNFDELLKIATKESLMDDVVNNGSGQIIKVLNIDGIKKLKADSSDTTIMQYLLKKIEKASVPNAMDTLDATVAKAPKVLKTIQEIVQKPIKNFAANSIDSLDELLKTATKESLLDDMANNNSDNIFGVLNYKASSKLNKDISNSGLTEDAFLKKEIGKISAKKPFEKMRIGSIDFQEEVPVLKKSIKDFASMSVDSFEELLKTATKESLMDDVINNDADMIYDVLNYKASSKLGKDIGKSGLVEDVFLKKEIEKIPAEKPFDPLAILLAGPPKNIIKILKKTYDLDDVDQLKKFKKDQNSYINKYAKSIAENKIPTPLSSAFYDNLDVVGKNAVVKKIANHKKKLGIADDMDVVPSTAPKVVVKKEFDFNNMKKYKEQEGSNVGGYYYNLDNPAEKYYVKIPQNEEIARNEVLAGKLYEAAGTEVPNLQIIMADGQKAVASTIVDGVEKNKMALINGAVRAGVYDDYVVDAWLANWDVVGLKYDNLMIKNGVKGVRIDVGGSLRFRAQGMAKGDKFGNKVFEMSTFRDIATNPQSESVFKHITKDELEAGARKVLAVPDSKIKSLVAEFGPLDIEERNKLADILIARKKYIQEQFPNIKVNVVDDLPKDLLDKVSDYEFDSIKKSRTNGFAIKFDKEDIEDHQILFWVEEDVSGIEQTNAILKVREKALEKINKQLKDISLDELSTQDVYDKYFEAFRGIAKQSRDGVLLRQKDIDRAMNCLKFLDKTKLTIKNGIDSGLYAKSSLNDFLKHYDEWTNVLENAINKNKKNEIFKWSKDDSFKTIFKSFAPIKKIGAKTKRINWTRKDGYFEEKVLDKGFARETGKTIELKIGSSGKTVPLWEYYYEADIDGARVRFWPDSPDIGFAQRGRVEIQVKGTANKNRMAKIIKTLDDLGVDTTRTTQLDDEYLYLKQILYVRNDDNFSQIMKQADSIIYPTLEDKVRFLRNSVSQSVGISDITTIPGYDYSGAREAFENGNIRWTRPDLQGREWNKFQQNYKLHHQIQGQTMFEALEAILNSGGNMLPTTQKLRYGFSWGGMSPTTDLNTGGASYCFTRIRTNDYCFKVPGLVWKSKQINRLDAISYGSDYFGECKGDFVQRHRGSKIDDWVNYGENYSNNETIFKNGLSLFDNFEAIVCEDNQERIDILSLLRKNKIIEFDGCPIEDAVMVRKY